MKKGLAVFIAAFFLLGVSGKAQAVIGIPDDVPASTLLFPFFKVEPQRTERNQLDTLLVVTNTYASSVIVHFTIWNFRSVHVYDFSVALTAHDVFSCSLYDLIVDGKTGCSNESGKVSPAPAGVADALKFTADNVTILAGYVTADVVAGSTSLFPGQDGYPFAYSNVLVGYEYLVNLPAGSSTGLNATSIESIRPCAGHNAIPDPQQEALNTFGFYRTRCDEEHGGSLALCAPVITALPSCTTPTSSFYSDLTERIDGPNGDFAQTGSGIDSPLTLIIRYFSQDALNGRSEVWLWKDRNTTVSLNVAVYDEAENFHSITYPLPDEVNFQPTQAIITPGAPGGWFRVKFPCGQFSSCGFDYAGNATATPPIQALAYSLQFANSLGSGAAAPGLGAEFLRWDAVFPAHRQYTNYLGAGE